MIPLPPFDASSDEPIYRQIVNFIKQKIRSGELAAGQRIPPTRELAGQLGLNRATIAAAYEILEAEGLIRGHVGRGSFVAAVAAPVGIAWEDRFAPSVSLLAPMSGGEAGICFASARPAEDLFPISEFRDSCEEVIRGADAAAILQLGSPYGYAPLRSWLAAQGRSQGTLRSSDDLLITNGCQQALDLLQRLLTQPGDVVFLEDPIYPGLRNVFARSDVRAVGVAVEAGGIDVETLARRIERDKPRLLVVTPNFQNPTGATMPLGARTALLKVAREAGLVVVENDIYGELRYEGEDLPSLKQMDATGDVIQVKSFSKLAFPGLRVGWVTGPWAVIARLAEWKQVSDLHSDQLSQAVLLHFAQSGRLAAHRRRMIEAGTERLHAVISACGRHLPAGSRFTRPQGGMNLWVRLPEPLDAAELLGKAQAAGVSYLPGRYFAVSRTDPGSLRLSFAGLTPEKIETGVAALGRVFREELQGALAARNAGLAPAIV
jgi:DNA-binding transcriptional MocR family regulator